VRKDGIKDENPTQVVTKTTFPFKHVDEKNEKSTSIDQMAYTSSKI